MKLSINSREYSLEEPLTLQTLLKKLSINTVGTAIAVNNSVIIRSQWQIYLLSDGDKITLIKATAGG